MDVDSFIAKYGPEWKSLDEAVARGAEGLTRLSGPQIADVIRLYLRASAHLAEARARYRDPALTTYLNGLVSRAHAATYGARARTGRGFVQLLTTRYREAIRETAPFVLIAAAVIVVVALASDLWIATSPEARAGLIPPAAQHAIRHAGGGRSPALQPAPALSTFILINNVQVAFFAFALGITLGLGTLWVLLQNSIVLGVLGGAFQALGKAADFWALIIPHGLLELTAICIAAGAGLRIGWSIVAPGDRPRARALAHETSRALIVVIGVVPAFVVAALVEGFVTGSAVPTPVQVALGVVLAAAYVWLLFGRPRARPRRERALPPPPTTGPGP